MISNILQKPLIAFSLILLAVVMIYREAPQGAFIWDDEFHIVDNHYIRDAKLLPQLLTSDLGEGAGVKYYFFRPIQSLTYALEFPIWKLNPAGYHLTNIVLHILTAFSLYILVRLLFYDAVLALISALLFAVHPAHTEAVAYIAGRSDMLCGIFVLWSLIFYIQDEQKLLKGRLILSLIAFVLALLSRESSLILIGLIPLYHFVTRLPIPWRKFGCLVAVGLIYIGLRMTLLSHLVKPWPTIEFFQQILLIPAAYTQYWKIILWPFNLHMEYATPVLEVSSFKVWVGGVLLVLTGFIMFLCRRNKILSFGLGWFVLTLLPILNIYPINAFVAEHWLYLPLMGLSLFAVGFIRVSKVWMGMVILIGIMILLGVRTFDQVKYWREPAAFFQQTLKYNPTSSRLFYNLGNFYFKHDYPADDIIQNYRQAIALSPRDANVHYNLALIYLREGKNVEAEVSLREVIQLDPDYQKAYEDLISILRNQNRTAEADVISRQAKQAR